MMAKPSESVTHPQIICTDNQQIRIFIQQTNKLLRTSKTKKSSNLRYDTIKKGGKKEQRTKQIRSAYSTIDRRLTSPDLATESGNGKGIGKGWQKRRTKEQERRP